MPLSVSYAEPFSTKRSPLTPSKAQKSLAGPAGAPVQPGRLWSRMSVTEPYDKGLVVPASVMPGRIWGS